jgi:hypothetical protein
MAKYTYRSSTSGMRDEIDIISPYGELLAVVRFFATGDEDVEHAKEKAKLFCMALNVPYEILLGNQSDN